MQPMLLGSNPSTINAVYHRFTLGSLTACSEAVCGPGGNSETFRVRNLDTYQDHASRLSEAV